MKYTYVLAVIMLAFGVVIGSGLTHNYDLDRAREFGHRPQLVCVEESSSATPCSIQPADDGLTVGLPATLYLKMVLWALGVTAFITPIVATWLGCCIMDDHARRIREIVKQQNEYEQAEREAADDGEANHRGQE